jgi:putative ABC transport system permease protein
MPGFQAVGMSLDRVGETWIHLPVTPEGQIYANPADRPEVNYRFISPDYFRALGVPLVQGRPFTANDDQNAPRVVMIDAAMARRYFPQGNAVGKRVELLSTNGQNAWVEIVGVAATLKSDGPAAEGRPDVYLPYAQTPTNTFFVHVRTSIEVATVGAMLAQALREIDPAVPIFDLANMEQVTAKPADARRFPLGLLGGFAALALGLAAIGIYGVTAYGVAQRTREIGVRMALGAQPRAVVALVLRQGLQALAIGIAVGLVGGVVTAFAMRKLLFDVAPVDVPTFAAIPLVLGAVTLLACVVPARRATRVNPVDALRCE